MRDIKFRAWFTKGKCEPMEGQVFSTQGDRTLGEFVRDIETTAEEYELKYELMQFTGLRDVQGKDIYEGDILKRGETTDLVVFRDGAFCVCFTSNHWHKDYTKTMHETLVNGPNRWKIIGNVFEHPDLLK